MKIEIHEPELVQRLNAHIQTGQCQDADELVEKALDALDEKAPMLASPAERRRAAGRTSLVELFAPLRGYEPRFQPQYLRRPSS